MRRLTAVLAAVFLVAPAGARAHALGTGATITTTPGRYGLPLVVTYTVDDGGCPDGTLTVAGFSTGFAPVTATIALAGPALEPGGHSLSIDASSAQVDGSSGGVASWSGTAPIPDGPSYSLTLTCGSGSDATSSTVSGISLRTSVVKPQIVDPVSFSKIDYPITVAALIQTPTDGTYQLVFTRDGRSVVFTEKGPDASASFPTVVRATIGAHSDLSDGTYELTVEYFDPLVRVEATSDPVSVTLSSATPPPTLHTPNSTTIGAKGEAITYTLPVDALSVALRLVGDGEYVVDLRETRAGTHTVVLDPEDLAKTGTPSAGRVVRDGRYELSVGYRDTSFHPVAFSRSIAVRIDKGTRPLEAKIAATSKTRVELAVYLPEAADGRHLEVRIERPGRSTSTLHVAVKPGLRTFALVRDDLAATSGASNVGGPNKLPAGTYTIVLTYRHSEESAPYSARLTATLP